MILRYLSNEITDFNGRPFWNFTPSKRQYLQLDRSEARQDFTAILLGDVSGNWMFGNTGTTVTTRSVKPAFLQVQSGRDPNVFVFEATRPFSSLSGVFEVVGGRIDSVYVLNNESEFWYRATELIDGRVEIEMMTSKPIERLHLRIAPSNILYFGKQEKILIQATNIEINEVEVQDLNLTFSNPVTNRFPTEYTIRQNYPNPFSSRTTIEYTIPQSGHVLIQVYDLLGKSIFTLVDADRDAGSYEIVWRGQQGTGVELAQGLYFVRITYGNNSKQIVTVLID